MSNSQSRAHLNRISLNISEVDAKHRRRFQSPSYRVFCRPSAAVATVLRGGEQLYPADPLAAKGEVGRSAFTFADADFSPAAAKECEMNITVMTANRSESNEPTLVVEEEVDGERGCAQTAATSSSSSKLTAEESLGYGKNTSSGVHSKPFVGMEDENQKLEKNGNKEEHDKLLSAHDPFGFPRPHEKHDLAPFPTHQFILKCVRHHDNREHHHDIEFCVSHLIIIIASHWLAMKQPRLSLFNVGRPNRLTNSTSGT